jgi:hypothetical protein
MSRRTLISVLAIALVGALALLATAADRPGEGPVPAPPRAVVDTDPSAVSPHYTAEELSLLAIQEEGRRQARELNDRLKTEIDPLRRDEIRQEIAALKMQSHVQFLEALAEFARERGDLEIEQQALAQIANLNRPRQVSTTPTLQTPGKAELQGGGK